MQESTVHNVILESRRKITVSGVEDMECFDEEKVIVYTGMGVLEIRGREFHMSKLSLDSGEIIVEGEIDAIIYLDGKKEKEKGFFAKLFG